MEVGAVIGAVPAENVRREKPIAGDIVIMFGGRTGRDGIGHTHTHTHTHTHIHTHIHTQFSSQHHTVTVTVHYIHTHTSPLHLSLV